MLNEKEFTEKLVKKVQRYMDVNFPDKKITVEAEEMEGKLSAKFTFGKITANVMTGTSYSFYMEQDDREQAEEEIIAALAADLAENMIKTSDKQNEIDKNMKKTYEEIKKDISIRVMNKNDSRFNEKMIHKDICGDITAVFCHYLGDIDDKTRVSEPVTGKNLEKWGINEEKFIEDAYHTQITEHKTKKMSLAELVGMKIGENDDMTVITNDEMQYGASELYTTEQLKELLKENPEGLYVIPSSKHEILCIRVTEENSKEESIESLKSMIKEINRNAVSEKDFLSDMLMIFDKKGLRTV